MTSLVRAASKLTKLTLLAATTAAVTADTTGASVDTLALDGDLRFIGVLSHGTGTGTAILKIQHCDTTDGSFTVITALTSGVAAATTGIAIDVTLDRAVVKRFLQAVVDVTGTTAITGAAYVFGVKHVN